MHPLEGEIVLSASDLTGFAACAHLTQLELSAVRDERERPTREDPLLDVLSRRGGEHETKHLERLRAAGKHVVVIDADRFTRAELEAAEAETVAAMRRGVDVIYQATFFDGTWRGHADFLLRVERPSDFGPWSYEVADTKLARRVKAGALLQMCHYSEHVARLQGVEPEHMHVVTGDGATHAEKVRDYAASYRALKARFERVVAQAAVATFPDPVEHCGICRWHDECEAHRRADDHLSLVAGMRSDQTRKLMATGLATRAALAAMPAGTTVDGIADATLEKLRHQAELQVCGEGRVPQLYELLAPEAPDPPLTPDGESVPWPKRGFAALPPPSPGDLFFDMEGDPYALDDGGLEYLFGVIELAPRGEPRYHAFWAHDRAEEKEAYEAFIDFVMARLAVHPDLHVYHYAFYEPSRVKHLMGLHGTREQEVDELLRGERFVDLYSVVHQGVRIGAESYGLKTVEQLYMERPAGDVAGGGESIVAYEDYLEDGDRSRLEAIERYNEFDCRSTYLLRGWLEEQRANAEVQFGEIPRPEPGSGEPSEELTAREAMVAQLAEQLTADVPAERDDRTDEQHARWLLAQMLQWHRREEKPEWWSLFLRVGYLAEDDFVADRECIGGLELIGELDMVKQSRVFRYRFEPQDHKFTVAAKPVDPATGKPAGEVMRIDDARGLVDLKRGPSFADEPHPTSLIPAAPVPTKCQQDALVEIAEWVLANGIDASGPHHAIRELLLSQPPEVRGVAAGVPIQHDGETGLQAARRAVLALDHSYLAIQGPPGSGKTFTGAHMIVDLVRAGKRVGITGNSHAVIGNLLDAVCKRAEDEGIEVLALQRAEDHQRCESRVVRSADSNQKFDAAREELGPHVMAGTAWLWTRDAMRGSVDVLFVDEAGQKSMADVAAVSVASESIVLLGDPQQLAHPSHGGHPDGAEVSALEHLLGDHETMPSELGMFLETTYRMHPDICAFVSELAYDSKLHAQPGLERQAVDGEAGLRWVPVEHHGNRSSSREEAEVVAEQVRGMIGTSWTDQVGKSRAMTLDDVLIVTPYNAQVAKLAQHLPDGARVGTVDRFQGREAPVVIYSLATSSADDVPRGMEFLYDLHRLNVAVSRAQAMTIIVANPQLLGASARTPKQLRMVSALCRADEMARGAAP